MLGLMGGGPGDTPINLKIKVSVWIRMQTLIIWAVYIWSRRT